MDRLDAMALFVTAVEQGSLAAAARRHGRSAATITRALTLLERQTGETLLLRSTRKLSLTAAGDRHLAIWRDFLERLGTVPPPAAGAGLHGGLALTAPELFGRIHVMPLVERFLQQHPHVSARVLLVNRLVDLTGEGIDLAVRLAPLPDSALTAVKVGTVATLVCASPDYLARAGVPDSPADLARHECIGLNVEGHAEGWSFTVARQGSRVRSVRVRTRLGVNGALASIDAAVRGHGIIRARSYQVTDEIASGRLVRILTESEPPPAPVHLVFPANRARSSLVRAFIEHAVPILRQKLR